MTMTSGTRLDDPVDLTPGSSTDGGANVWDASAPATIRPRRPHPEAPAPIKRPIGGVSRRDLFTVFGALVSALSTTLLLFGRMTSLSGKLGFAVVAFVLFLVVYAVLVSLTENRTAVVDRVMSALMTGAAMLAGGALVSVVAFTLWRGRSLFLKTNFYIEDMSLAGPQEPLSVGGISHAIVGTLIIISISIVLTVPLAIVCAVFLNETGGRSTELVRSVVTAMTALPSIVAGLFIFATWILVLGYERSGLAASFAVSIMMLPIIVRSADVVLRLVPGSLREASEALGAPQWQTVRHVVLPTARPGLATSIILGVARGVGETAPVLLVSGITATMNVDPTRNPMMSLPLATFEFVRSPQPNLVARGFATAGVLMVVVLVLFSIARILGGRQAGQLSGSQARRAIAASKKDVERFEARSERPAEAQPSVAAVASNEHARPEAQIQEPS